MVEGLRAGKHDNLHGAMIGVEDAHVFRTDTPLGVVDQTLAQKVEAVRACCGEQVAEWRLRELSDRTVVRELRVSLGAGATGAIVSAAARHAGHGEWKVARAYRPVLLGRRAKGAEDRFELVHVGLTG